MDFSAFAAGLPDPDPDDPEIYSDDPLDELIARRVADRFLRDPEIRSGHVLVAVQNRVVILKGRVDSDDARAAASKQAWSTPGVYDVCNRLLT